MEIKIKKGKYMSVKHFQKEITIAGETIKAEYFEADSAFTIECNSRFNLWYIITLPFYRLKRKIRDIYWEIRYGFQRMFKGYDYVDTFGLCDKFIDRYYKILTEYKKNMHGHPARFSEEEWNAIIDKMLLHLYYMDEDNVDEELCKDVPENWIPRWDTTYPIMEHHKNEFFRLFSEHFYDLWD